MVCRAGSTFPPRPATHSAMRFVLNPAGRSTSKAKGRWRPISFIANKAARTLFGFLRLFDQRFISVFERRFYRLECKGAGRFLATGEVRCCEGFRTTADRDRATGTGAVVGKPPGKEPAGS